MRPFMARISWLLLFIGIAVGGCAVQYATDLQLKALEAQTVPPKDYKADLLAFLQTYLNNPENVREAAISEPQKLVVLDLERYAACVRFNTKNSAGRYLGLRDHLAVFISGKLDRLIELGRVTRDGAAGSPALQPLRDHCARVTYQPFPELEKLRR
jgi:hypothetical protein